MGLDREPSLSAALEPLKLPPRDGLRRLRELAFRYVQLSAAQPGLRPRELDRSARRDLTATLRRLELACSGVDLWIPPAHLTDPSRIDRAVSAILDAVEFSAEIASDVLCVSLPVSDIDKATLTAIVERAATCGVAVANFHEDAAIEGVRCGIDSAAILSRGGDPAAVALEAGERVAACRLADVTASGLRAPLGESDGRLDVLAFQVALNTIGFERPPVIDMRQWNDPEAGLLRTRDVWRSAAAMMWR